MVKIPLGFLMSKYAFDENGKRYKGNELIKAYEARIMKPEDVGKMLEDWGWPVPPLEEDVEGES